MSKDVKHYVLLITEKLDYATVDVYLLKHGIVTVAEFESFWKALQNGSSTNGDLVRKLLVKISEKPREFYKALREHVNDKSQNVHAGNKELCYQLPDSFGKKNTWNPVGRFKSKNKSPISTIVEDPLSSNDTEKAHQQTRVSSHAEDCMSSEDEREFEDEMSASFPPGPNIKMSRSTSTQSFKRENRSRHSSTNEGDTNIHIRLSTRYPSTQSLPPTFDEMEEQNDVDKEYFKEKYYKLLEENLERLKAEGSRVTEEKMSLQQQLETLTKEKETIAEKLKQAEQQLQETRSIQEKQFSDMRAKLDEEKGTVISQTKELQNLIKEKEKLQSNLQASKKHNLILLDEKSRMHSAMQELQNACDKISQLKEEIERSKFYVQQNSQAFIQALTLLKQQVQENINIKNKANQDCSSIMFECAKIIEKVNATLHENRYLKDSQGSTRHGNATSPTCLLI